MDQTPRDSRRYRLGVVATLALLSIALSAGIAVAATRFATTQSHGSDTLAGAGASPASTTTPSPPQGTPSSTSTLPADEGEATPEGGSPGVSVGSQPGSQGGTSSPPVAPPADISGPAIAGGGFAPGIILNSLSGCPNGHTLVWLTITDGSGIASVSAEDDFPDTQIFYVAQEGDRYAFEASGSSLQPWSTDARAVTVTVVATDGVGNSSSTTRTYSYYGYDPNCKL